MENAHIVPPRPAAVGNPEADRDLSKRPPFQNRRADVNPAFPRPVRCLARGVSSDQQPETIPPGAGLFPGRGLLQPGVLSPGSLPGHEEFKMTV